MKKAFTILELLVASLLLGMLTTILTMLFNQSSIAWRTGTATVEDMGDVRENIAKVAAEADNIYIWADGAHLLLSPWSQNGTDGLRKRAISAGSESSAGTGLTLDNLTESTRLSNLPEANVGSGNGSAGGRNYTVNVMSAGPNRLFNDWDDIWSFPDDYD